MEYLGVLTKVLFAVGGGVSFLLWFCWYLFKERLQADKNEKAELKASIASAKATISVLNDKVNAHNTEIEVLKESKIGKTELQKEMAAIQSTIELRLTDFKQELREDLKPMQDNIALIMEYLMKNPK